MERPVGVTRLRQGLSVFVGLGVILTLVVVMASILGGGSGGYSPPSEEEKEGLVEVEMIASSPKLDVPSGLRELVGPPQGREIVAAQSLTDNDLVGIRTIRVKGARNARSTSRRF